MLAGSVVALALFLIAPCGAQRWQDVTFHVAPGPLASGHSAYVLGDLPELGGSDLVRAVRMVDTGAGWQVVVRLPVNVAYSYRFFDRDHSDVRAGDPQNGVPLGPVRQGSTPTVALWPRAKRILYHGSQVAPSLYWRQGGGAFASVPMTRVGPGRSAGESRWEAASVGAARSAIEFYVAGPGGAGRDPSAGAYTTRLDASFLQDAHLFTYVPAPAVAPHRRDYELDDPPEFRSAILGDERGVRVMLPRGYDQQTSRRYPVLYAHDGWVWFDSGPDSLDRDGDTLGELTRSGAVREMIVVGIDHPEYRNLNISYMKRMRDFMPRGDWGVTPWGLVPGEADRYARFVVDELKPWIDARYRTLPDRAHTWTAGFSYGALVSTYLGWDHEATFSRVGCLAGSFFALNFLARVAREPRRDLRFYLDTGTVNDTYDSVLGVYRDLLRRPDPYVVEGDLRLRLGIGHSHSSRQVALRFPAFAEFLFSTGDAPNELLCGAVPYGTGLGGLQTLDLSWSAIGNTNGSLVVTGARANARGVLAFALAPARIDILGLPVLVELSPRTESVAVAFDAAGRTTIPFDLRQPTAAGHQVFVQAFEVGSAGLFTSGGMELSLCR